MSASYSYNGDGLRVAKTTGGATTNYAWDPTGLPVVVSDGNEYVWGRGLISQVTSGGTATYAHADGLGSIRVLTDGSGTVVGTKQYDAFGAGRATTGVQLPFGYTGEQEDGESGLVYLRARYMDPASGRFLTGDPLASNPGWVEHPYGYVLNDPISGLDPTGLFKNPLNAIKNAPQAIANLAGRAPAAVSSLSSTASSGVSRIAGAAQAAVHTTLNVIATAPYAVYYFSYQTLSHPYLLPLAMVLSGGLASPQMLFVAQFVGLAGDIGFDWVKQRTVAPREALDDEGIRGPFIPRIFGHKIGPDIFLPGWEGGGRWDVWPLTRGRWPWECGGE